MLFYPYVGQGVAWLIGVCNGTLGVQVRGFTAGDGAGSERFGGDVSTRLHIGLVWNEVEP
jgi:hypothetical protein